jgi:hypothetical protein
VKSLCFISRRFKRLFNFSMEFEPLFVRPTRVSIADWFLLSHLFSIPEWYPPLHPGVVKRGAKNGFLSLVTIARNANVTFSAHAAYCNGSCCMFGVLWLVVKFREPDFGDNSLQFENSQHCFDTDRVARHHGAVCSVGQVVCTDTLKTSRIHAVLHSCSFFLSVTFPRVLPRVVERGHGPHSSQLVVICVVLLFVLFSVLFVCKCVLYYCHRVSTQ